MTDDRSQTFRERVPIVTKMIASAFNGDAPDDAEPVWFVLVASQRVEGSDHLLSLMTNLGDVGHVLAMLRRAAVEATSAPPMRMDDETDGPVGHA